MCGIAGIWSRKENHIRRQSLLEMMTAMKHRGPDAEGVWSVPGLMLGHKRLKILDLSDAANQPFSDGKNALVFNGEIFNYLCLKKELSGMFNFRTQSDTEVLFYALQVWGEKALDKIDGQFAFAFYDSSARTLILARDHAGICPLYTLQAEDTLYFASEIKPLLSIKKRSLNAAGVVDYFMYRYNIQNGRTLFSDIRRFPPAHFLKIDLNTGYQTERCYWRLEFNKRQQAGDQAQLHLNRTIDSEITAQKMADVPVGMYLSGGIDSRALLSGFAKSTPDIKSFTLTFSKKDSDYYRVEELAKRFKFQRNTIEFSENDFNNLEDAVRALEEPFGDLIICANYVLARKASESVRVVLSGEGGDEAFCGYDHQRAFFRLLDLSRRRITDLFLNSSLKILPPMVFKILKLYPGIFGHDELLRIRKVSRKICEPVEAYLDLIALFDRDELKSLFSAKFINRFPVDPDTKPIREIFAKEQEVWHAVMRSEIEQLTLIINLLKHDRFGMNFSMEGRLPFVSRQVLQFSASLPYSELYSKVNKSLLLNYSGYRGIQKKPFSVFTNQSHLDTLIRLMDRYVTQDKVIESGILSWPEIQRLRSKLARGGLLSVKRAMAVVVFMVWLKIFRDNLQWQ